jgi:hypothetical protein
MKVTIRTSTSITSSSKEITKEKISMYKFGKVRKVEKAIKSNQTFKSKDRIKGEKEKSKIDMKMKFR